MRHHSCRLDPNHDFCLYRCGHVPMQRGKKETDDVNDCSQLSVKLRLHGRQRSLWTSLLWLWIPHKKERSESRYFSVSLSTAIFGSQMNDDWHVAVGDDLYGLTSSCTSHSSSFYSCEQIWLASILPGTRFCGLVMLIVSQSFAVSPTVP